eukprot:gene19136-6438_t
MALKQEVVGLQLYEHGHMCCSIMNILFIFAFIIGSEAARDCSLYRGVAYSGHNTSFGDNTLQRTKDDLQLLANNGFK